jgi:transposase-like protein
MDTCEQVAIETASHAKRRRRSVEEKRRIVEETLEAGAARSPNSGLEMVARLIERQPTLLALWERQRSEVFTTGAV